MKTELERLEHINTTCNTNYKSMDEVDWWWLTRCQILSEHFIREFQDKVDWGHISAYQQLSEDFIREFSDKVNWVCISVYQKLSEDFIREFQDKFEWYYISKYQKISEDFIREFKDNMVWWLCISKYQTLSESFIKEFQERLGDVKEKSWLYKDKEFLKQQVLNIGLYECHDDYFIAYKGIRSNRYSAFNFQYQYLPGETYEAHCDCTVDENSFGLSVWTEEKAREFCNQLIVKVKINYEDIGRVVHEGGKIRCRKITILN